MIAEPAAGHALKKRNTFPQSRFEGRLGLRIVIRDCTAKRDRQNKGRGDWQSERRHQRKVRCLGADDIGRWATVRVVSDPYDLHGEHPKVLDQRDGA
jgi:hypothetical protein